MAGREGDRAGTGDRRALESRGLYRDEVLAELEDVRQDSGAALERESDGLMAELAREWVRIGAAEASASEEELRAEPLPIACGAKQASTMPPGYRWRPP